MENVDTWVDPCTHLTEEKEVGKDKFDKVEVTTFSWVHRYGTPEGFPGKEYIPDPYHVKTIRILYKNSITCPSDFDFRASSQLEVFIPITDGPLFALVKQETIYWEPVRERKNGPYRYEPFSYINNCGYISDSEELLAWISKAKQKVDEYSRSRWSL